MIGERVAALRSKGLLYPTTFERGSGHPPWAVTRRLSVGTTVEAIARQGMRGDNTVF
jgi:hypothetical protein